MPSLFELQQQFAAALNRKNTGILQHIQSDAKLSAAEHLAIYQNSVLAALQNVLKEIYPVCFKLVGEDFFLAMANEYITKTPSTAPDIGSYGISFPDFIADFSAADAVPYLADTARLEWAWHIVFHAANSRHLDFQKLAACYEEEGENIIFSLPEGCVLLASPYPIHQIWEMNQPSYQNEEPLVLKENQRYFFLIWRQGFTLRVDLLTETDWKIMHWMQQNLTLSQICTALHKEFPAASIAELLPQFVSRGWLTGFTVQTPAELP